MTDRFKVVVLSQEPLPYVRVERIIYSILKKNYDVYLISKYEGNRGIVDFCKVKIINLPYSLHGLITLSKQTYKYKIKKYIRNTLKKLKPDVIIAYDLYSAMIVYDLGYHVIFDDAEYLSIKTFMNINTLAKANKLRYYLNMFYVSKLLELEQSIAIEFPVITVSRVGYIRYRYSIGSRKVCMIPNFPTRNEVQYAINSWEYIDARQKHPVIFNYIGNELFEPYTARRMGSIYRAYGNYYRRMTTASRIFNLLYKKYKKAFYIDVIGSEGKSVPGFVRLKGYKRTHNELFKALKGAHFGLLVYDPHEFHHWASANRTSIYGINGIIPIITSSFTNEYYFYKDYAIFIDEVNFEGELKEKIELLIDNGVDENLIKQMRDIAYYSRRKTLWDNYDKCLLDLIDSA